MLVAKTESDIETLHRASNDLLLASLKNKLTPLPLRERLSIPHLPAARADIMPTALSPLMPCSKSPTAPDLTHSFYNLRYGVAASVKTTNVVVTLVTIFRHFIPTFSVLKPLLPTLSWLNSTYYSAMNAGKSIYSFSPVTITTNVA